MCVYPHAQLIKENANIRVLNTLNGPLLQVAIKKGSVYMII